MNIKTLLKQVEKVSEIYSKRYGINLDHDWYMLKLQEELGELTQAYLKMKGRGRTKKETDKELKASFAKEIADLLCHTLLIAQVFDVDINKEMQDKWLKWIKD